MSRKSVVTLALIFLALFFAAYFGLRNLQSKNPSDFDLVKDIKTICKEVPRKYAYFEARAAHWDETCRRAEKEASAQPNRREALGIIERMVDDLYDPHATLNRNNKQSPRLVPSGSDLAIEARRDRYVITAVRPGSGAAKAGVKIGDELITFNGITPSDLALTRIHSGRVNPQSDRVIWAINAAVAGTRAEPRNIEVQRDGVLMSFDLGTPEISLPDEPISFKVLSGSIGYVRFNNSLGNSETVDAFDKALEELRQTDGLILDLRETPGGGNTGVAEPVMGRFIEKPAAYQRTVLRGGRKIDRKIKPSGPWTYSKPLIILVGRWTGSMGEGMAIGFDGTQRGRVMGSPMARLAGGTEGIRLGEMGIYLNIPTYDLRHLDGTPRHHWAPPKIMTADNGAGKDVLLETALMTFREGE